MRHLLKPSLKKLNDLRDGLYYKPKEYLYEEDVISWVHRRLNEESSLTATYGSLSERLNQSWGAPGEPGSIEEIHHICCLFGNYLEEVVKHEEQTFFVNVPEEAEPLVNLIKDRIGSQVQKITIIPDKLDEVVSLIDNDHGGTINNPHVVTAVVEFELPDGWSKAVQREVKKLSRNPSDDAVENKSGGLWSFFWIGIILFLIIALL